MKHLKFLNLGAPGNLFNSLFKVTKLYIILIVFIPFQIINSHALQNCDLLLDYQPTITLIQISPKINRKLRLKLYYTHFWRHSVNSFSIRSIVKICDVFIPLTNTFPPHFRYKLLKNRSPSTKTPYLDN